MPDPRSLVLIPVYNHGGTLADVARRALDQGLPVLVVDDGSDAPVAPALADLPLEVLRLPENRGKGAALLAGAAWARERGHDLIITLDADGQHHPEDLPVLLAEARQHWPCVVVGCRDLGGPHVPASSRFGRAFSNFWVRLECGQTLTDTQSGFRIYPTELLEASRFVTRRYTFEVEVLVRAVWAGLAVRECPIGVTYQPGAARISHFHAFRDNLRLSLLHTWLVTRTLLPWPRGPIDAPGQAREVLGEAREALFHPLRFLSRLVREHGSPLELGAAVWLGVFLGCLPIIPFGLAVILYVAHRLNLNKLAAAGASNVCVAPFVPFLCIQVGHLLRHGAWWTDYSRQTLVSEIHLRLLEWLLGALVAGPILGLLVALPVGWALARRRALRRAIRRA